MFVLRWICREWSFTIHSRPIVNFDVNPRPGPFSLHSSKLHSWSPEDTISPCARSMFGSLHPKHSTSVAAECKIPALTLRFHLRNPLPKYDTPDATVYHRPSPVATIFLLISPLNIESRHHACSTIPRPRRSPHRRHRRTEMH